MKNIIVKGTQEFMGKEIPIVEGGFGEGQRAMSDKTIADVHGMMPKHIRERIAKNIGRFREGIDFIDLKKLADQTGELEKMGYPKQTITMASNIFLLSERGYGKLIKIMDSDLAWEIYDKLLDDYFTMRSVIKSEEQMLKDIAYRLLQGGVDGIAAGNELANYRVQQAVTPLHAKLEEQKPLVTFADTVLKSKDSIDMNGMAKLIKDEGIDIGRNKLIKHLKNRKILMSDNMPYQTYMNRGYFEVVEVTKDTAFGTKIFRKTVVTPKGQIFVVNEVKNNYSAA